MENNDVITQHEDEVVLPVDLERYLKDNIGVFKFAGDVLNLYSVGFAKVGLEMITPSSYEFEQKDDHQKPENKV